MNEEHARVWALTARALGYQRPSRETLDSAAKRVAEEEHQRWVDEAQAWLAERDES